MLWLHPSVLVVCGVVLGLPSAAAIDLTSDLTASLSGSGNNIVLTITNSAAEDAYVNNIGLPLSLPADADPRMQTGRSLFSVGDAEYRGAIVLFDEPSFPEDFEKVPAFGSFSTTFDLFGLYDIPGSGFYNVKYDAFFEYSDNLACDSTGTKCVSSISSSESTLNSGEIIVRHLDERSHDNIRRLAVKDEFEDCGDNEKALKAALKAAHDCVTNVLAVLAKILKSEEKDDDNYFKMWFGSVTAAKIKTITDNFKAIEKWILPEAKRDAKYKIKHFCVAVTDSACGKTGNSYVFEGVDGKIYFCPRYFKKKKDGKQSQKGIFMHEVSHFDGSAGTEDEQPHSGTDLAKKMAKEKPADACVNSYSHQYYLECLPKEGNVGGDPHFSTWTHEDYSFQGMCDLVLLQNPLFANGLGIDIHIRTKLHGSWSGIDVVAIRIGTDILEVQGKTSHWLNGVYTAELPAKLGGYELTVDSPAPHIRHYIVHLGHGERIHIDTFKEYVWVEVEGATLENFRGSEGMLGSFGTGEKMARDGISIINDENEFGQEWQVRDTDIQLFQTPSGPQYPQRCKMPAVDVSSTRRRLGEGISPRVARRACDHVPIGVQDNCVFDVMSTNDLEMADAYASVSM